MSPWLSIEIRMFEFRSIQDVLLAVAFYLHSMKGSGEGLGSASAFKHCSKREQKKKKKILLRTICPQLKAKLCGCNRQMGDRRAVQGCSGAAGEQRAGSTFQPPPPASEFINGSSAQDCGNRVARFAD